MRIFTVFLMLLVTITELKAGSWCKAIYNKDVSDGEIKSRLKNVETQITFFLRFIPITRILVIFKFIYS